MYTVMKSFDNLDVAISEAKRMKHMIEKNLKLSLNDIYNRQRDGDDNRGWKLGGSGVIIESTARYQISLNPDLHLVDAFLIPNTMGIYVVRHTVYSPFTHLVYEIMITPEPHYISKINTSKYQMILGMLENWDGETLDGPYGLDRIILEMDKLRLDVEKANEKKTKFKNIDDTPFGDYINKISKEVSTRIKIMRDPISVHDILSGEDKDGDWEPWIHHHESIHMSNQEALKKNGK